MGTFVAAYMAVWLSVLLYVARLGVRQRQLAQDLESLQLQLDRAEDTGHPTTKAA